MKRQKVLNCIKAYFRADNPFENGLFMTRVIELVEEFAEEALDEFSNRYKYDHGFGWIVLDFIETASEDDLWKVRIELIGLYDRALIFLEEAGFAKDNDGYYQIPKAPLRHRINLYDIKQAIPDFNRIARAINHKEIHFVERGW